jgi:Zn-dependent peptidase ImmA (M78 family)/transcriptional regulator with XRE-family HTH domain
MAIDQQLLGQKLTRYRTQFDRSLAEVANATGISPAQLEAYEAGEIAPTGDEILIFADYYKCDYKFFISNEKLTAFEETETLFRRYGNEFSRQDRWSVQECLFLCECEDFLQKQLNKGTAKGFVFRKSTGSGPSLGEDAAAQLRRFQNYPPTGIPLDIYRDFRSVGLHVFRRRLGNSNISGLYVKLPAAGRCVLVNYDEDVYRQRFTAAHELCHAILDSNAEFVVSLQSERGEPQEVRANKFAAHYLAPSSFLKSIPEPRNWDTKKATIWANRMNVSTEMLAYALYRERLISRRMIEIIKSVRVPKQLKIDPEIPTSLSQRSVARKRELLFRGLSDYYVKLCFEGYREGVISASRMGEMLLLESDSDLRSLANLYGERLEYAN